MKLYRGDNIFNTKTNPGIYRNNGIRAKAFGSGSNPENIELLGMIQSIVSHIRPISDPDAAYYDVTDFISFSENLGRAMYWCSDRGRLLLNECQDFQETRYLFTADIEQRELKALGSGIYFFEYKCNPLLKGSDSGQLLSDSVIRLASSTEQCPHCFPPLQFHRLVMINSYEYLQHYPDHQRLEGALQFAKGDEEWLLLPFDTMGRHRTTRIPRADFWSAKLFSVVGEQRPDMGQYP